MSKIHPHLNKQELLSPAGDLECFFAAVENGADAVYFGLKDFSARAGADNFTIDDASKAIAYARKKSVKVYITINTLIKTHELEKVVDCLIALDELQPDALIIQDLGLHYLLQSQFPHLKLHASTQMTIHNLAGVRQLEKMGFKRAVLSRELSVGEMRNITKNSSMEIEVFVHGALCYSYSGLCFFSSMMGGRSGNRGRCAQPCRMYYTTPSGEGGYLFSMKDLRALSHLNELMDAGVSSFKIEGRMKSPEYVAVVTHVYRQAIDGTLEDINDAGHLMNTVFSRESTCSYLFDKGYQANSRQIRPSDTINPSYPANMGSYAGEVIKSGKGCVTIRAEVVIGVRDLLQVFEEVSEKPALLHVKDIKVDGKRVFEVKAGSIATIESTQQLRPGARLYLISSQKVKETFAPKAPKKLDVSRVPVDLEISIQANSIGIKGVVRKFSFSTDYPVKLEKGVSRTTVAEDVKACFSRLGETPFVLAGIHISISGDLFIPLSVLNEIRRDYFQTFSEEWRKDRERGCENIKKWILEKCSEYSRIGSQLSGESSTLTSPNASLEKAYREGLKGEAGDEIRLSLKVDKLHYLNHIPLKRFSRIYIVLAEETVLQLKNNNEAIISGIKDRVVFSLPAIMRDVDNGYMTYGYVKQTVQDLILQGFRQFQISNLGALELFEGEEVMVYADYPLYCLNPLSAMKLADLGFCRHTHSPEDDKENLGRLFSRNADLIVYQDVPLFTSETCVWANMKNACPGRSRCGFKQVLLKNEHGDRFVALDEACKTVVIGERPFSITHLIPRLIDAGQKVFRVDFCYRDYTPEMINGVLSSIQNQGRIKNSIVGNYERGLI